MPTPLLETLSKLLGRRRIIIVTFAVAEIKGLWAFGNCVGAGDIGRDYLIMSAILGPGLDPHELDGLWSWSRWNV